jgi:hypothetical protein
MTTIRNNRIVDGRCEEALAFSRQAPDAESGETERGETELRHKP